MRNPSTLLRIFIMMAIVAISLQAYSQAQAHTITFIRYAQSPDFGSLDFPDKGQRAPSRTVTCYIDSQFRSMTFSPDISDLILSYEIWTADQSICIGSYDEDKEFLPELAQCSTTVTIVLDLDGGSCVGVYTP